MPILLLLIFSLIAAAFSAPSESLAGKKALGITTKETLVWPGPPEAPRIKFLYSFMEPRDLGFKVSILSRIKKLLVGTEDRRFVRPYAVAAVEGLVVVVDPGAKVVSLFDTNRGKSKRLKAIRKELLLSPVGVAIGLNRIYISDSSLGKVFCLDREGNYRFTIEEMSRPTGLAFHIGSRRLYAADALKHTISAFDERGQKIFSFGKRGYGDGELNFPTHIHIRGDTIYVNDTMNFRVQAFDLEGNHLMTLGRHGDGSGDFAQPKGIGVDDEGHIYVVDSLADVVQIFDADGRFLLSFGNQGGGLGEFWLPAGLHIYKNIIYVADSYNRRVQVFQFLGSKLR